MYRKSSLGNAEEIVRECEPNEQENLLAVSCPATIIRSSSWQSQNKEKKKDSFPPRDKRYSLSPNACFSASTEYSKLTNNQISFSRSASPCSSSTRTFLAPPSWSDLKKGLKRSFTSLIQSHSLSKKKSITQSTESNRSYRRYRHEELSVPHDETYITLNVSGKTFKIQNCFLSVYPETLLGSETKDSYYDKDNEEYFFDRDPESFRHILSFYYTGKLHLPRDECLELVIDELNFFNISPETYMCDCCWSDVYDPGLSRLHAIKEEKKISKVSTVKKEIPVTRNVRKKIWFILENPEVCLFSNIFHILNVLIILVSIIANITETIPCSNTLNVCKEQHKENYFLIDTVCVAFFTAEYVIRFSVCPNRLKFVISYMSIIDLLAILPYYINLVVEQTSGSSNLEIDALIVLRILRIFRIFKVMRHSKRLQELTESIKNSSTELGFILFIYIIVVVLCASIIYFAEIVENNIFASIPDGMWYAVVTSTTVG